MCPARAILRTAGYELVAGDDLPRQVTEIRVVTSETEPAMVPA